jgi:trans-aconitate 2-methyltransferase
MPWNPEIYTRFEKERYAPFEDLAALVKHRHGLYGIDLGCGTGELTKRLQERLPGSTFLGIDSSSEMLVRAKNLERTDLRFEQIPIEEVEGSWDLIFSHAALHWVADHPELLRRLFAMLNQPGQLVVQVPSNYNHPVMRLIPETAGEEPFVSALNGWKQPVHVLKIAEYAQILYDLGAANITIYEKIYPYVLKDSDALAEWTSGTALVPYMERLPEELKEPFMKEYRRKLHQKYPQSPVFFGFARILFSVEKI